MNWGSGSNQYVLGAPLFKKAVVHLENGNTVEINAPANSAENIYVDGMKVNGETYTKNFLTHEDLQKGMKIDMQMSNQPNTTRGTAEEDLPYSFSKER